MAQPGNIEIGVTVNERRAYDPRPSFYELGYVASYTAQPDYANPSAAGALQDAADFIRTLGTGQNEPVLLAIAIDVNEDGRYSTTLTLESV